MRETLGGAGHQVACAVLRAPRAECMARTESRSSLRCPTVAASSGYGTSSPSGPLEAHVIDNGAQGPEATANVVAERLEGEVLVLGRIITDTMTDQEPLIEWSRHATVGSEDGRTFNAFVSATYVVRAVWTDGTIKVRLLTAGEAGRRPHAEDDREFASAVRDRLEAQAENIVVEEQGRE
jgi:hypothetical protein